MRRAQGSSSSVFAARALWRRTTSTSIATSCVSAAHSSPQRHVSTESTAAAQTAADSADSANTSAAAAAATTTPTTASVTAASRPHRQLRLAVVRPDLLDDWIPELNDVDAQQISCADATTAVWWRCPRCGARYQSTVQSRVARGRAACPHCSGQGTHMPHTETAAAAAEERVVASESANTSAAAVDASNASLAFTHPQLAACWDAERNGGLLPTQVTAASTRSVWWRPAPRAAISQRSFQRPVFAYVMDATSPAEQAAATASMEWVLLAKIREAARIAEAEQLGALPLSLAAAAGALPQCASAVSHTLHDSAAWSEAAAAVAADADLDADEHAGGATSTSAMGRSLTTEDAAAVAFLWKPRVKQYVRAAQPPLQTGDVKVAPTFKLSSEVPSTGADDSGAPSANTNTPASPMVLPRELFTYSFSSTLHQRDGASATATAASHRASTTASIVRETLLNQYCDFVRQQRRGSTSSSSSPSESLSASQIQSLPLAPPPVLRLDGRGQPDDAPWIEYFRLTAEEVKPRGYIDPDASLYFAERAERTEGGTAAAAVVNIAPSATLDAPLIEFASTATTSKAPATRSRTHLPVSTSAAASLRPPHEVRIAEDAEVVFAYCPRRPQNPPAWEDDVAESAPPPTLPGVMTSFSAASADALVDGDATYHDHSSGEGHRVQPEERLKPRKTSAASRRSAVRNTGFSIEAPFGHRGDARAAHPLRAEYDDDNTEYGGSRDAGAALAAELRAAGGGGTSEGEEHTRDTAAGASAASLVNSAIAALGAAFHPTTGADDVAVEFADQSTRRYHRGAHQSTSLNLDVGTVVEGDETAEDAPRRAFRLSMPHLGLGGRLQWRREVSKTATWKEETTGKRAKDQQQQQQQQPEASSASAAPVQFDAPQSPRKVARPRRVRKDA